MIRKSTRMVFQDGNGQKTEEMAGGVPLSKGEMVRVHKGGGKTGKAIVYEVADKAVDCFLKGRDQTVNITYVLKRK
jgi:hypothetical protein